MKTICGKSCHASLTIDIFHLYVKTLHCIDVYFFLDPFKYMHFYLQFGSNCDYAAPFNENCAGPNSKSE